MYNLIDTTIELLIYVSVGIIAMIAGYFLIDLAIPVKFDEEIKNNNKAVAWLSAGIYIGLGLIIKSAIQNLAISEARTELIFGIIDTVFYSVVGILLFILSYYFVDIIHRKYQFNQALKDKNEAVGIMVFGIFIGIALIVSGVIL